MTLFATALLMATASVADTFNLLPLRPQPEMSWMKGWEMPRKYWKMGADSIVVTASPKEDISASLYKNPLRFDVQYPSFVASGRIRVTFRYRSDVDAEFYGVLVMMENKKCSNAWRKPLMKSGGWKEFVLERALPPGDYWTGDCTFNLKKGSGRLEVRDFRLVELPPERTVGRPLLLNGTRVTEIAVLGTDDVMRARDELRAARMLRYVLFQNGGDYLPVRIVDDVKVIAASAVLIGRAAEVAGLVSPDAAASVKGYTGAAAVRVRGGRLGISGGLPGGNRYGVFKLLQRLGIEYLGVDKFKVPAGDSFGLDEFAAVYRPAIPFRTLGGEYDRAGMMSPDLRGGILMSETMGNLGWGSKRTNYLSYHSFAAGICRPDEFLETHPEFFAQQPDGHRLGKETPMARMQFCQSNAELVKLAAARYIEIMRANPQAVFFPLSPGDGGGTYCRCKGCDNGMTPSDKIVEFANRIAEITSKEFPDKFIEVASYVNTPMAPAKVKPHPNVKAQDCIYPPDYWPSCIVWDHPANKPGFEALAGWRKVFPDLILCGYYQQCNEGMTLWPAFDFEVAMTRDFARHHALQVERFGLTPLHGNGSTTQTAAFADLRSYVLVRLEENPDADAVALAHGFIDDYYGAAAKPLHAYFDLIRAEPQRRNWVQNCEEHRPGFVTRPFAEKAFKLLDEAERLAGTDAWLCSVVLREKQLFLWQYVNDIPRANVTKVEYPAWAARFGEFCRISRELGIGYMAYLDPRKWILSKTLLKVSGSGGAWYDAPEIKAVIEDPVKGLGAEFPNRQENTADGYLIPAVGMIGGDFYPKSTWMRKDPQDNRTLRRPESGNGEALTKLNLKEVPSGRATLTIVGNDNDHKRVADMEVVVNGRSIFKGKVTFPKDGWAPMMFDLPDGLLVTGENDIAIRNVTPESEKVVLGGERVVEMSGPKNFYWGWFSVESLRFDWK